jgi:indolepyruvate ferredoxin oxidoreductase
MQSPTPCGRWRGPYLPSTPEDLIETRAQFLNGYQDAPAQRYRTSRGIGRMDPRVSRAAAVCGRSSQLVQVDGPRMSTRLALYRWRVREKLERRPATFAEGASGAIVRQARSSDGPPQEARLWPPDVQAFGILGLKGLRGTAFDVFGYTQERRTERRLIDDYMLLLDELTRDLTPENHNLAVQLAMIPEQIRGFGHVKEKNLARAKANESALLETFRSKPGKFASAAE